MEKLHKTLKQTKLKIHNEIEKFKSGREMEKTEYVWKLEPYEILHSSRRRVRLCSLPFFGTGEKHRWQLNCEETSALSLSLMDELAPDTLVFASYSFTITSMVDGIAKDVPGGDILFYKDNYVTPRCSFPSHYTPHQSAVNISVIIQTPSAKNINACQLKILQPKPAPLNRGKYNSDLLSALKKGDFSDVSIVTSDKTFKCHKAILASRSSYFDLMFKSGLSESKDDVIQITDFDSETIENMITYLYTSEFKIQNLNLDSATEIFRAADKYQLLDLKEDCGNFLKTAINGSNAMSILFYADLCSAKMLKKAAMDFICENMSAFTGASQYEPLMTRPQLLRDLLVAIAADS